MDGGTGDEDDRHLDHAVAHNHSFNPHNHFQHDRSLLPSFDDGSSPSDYGAVASNGRLREQNLQNLQTFQHNSLQNGFTDDAAIYRGPDTSFARRDDRIDGFDSAGQEYQPLPAAIQPLLPPIDLEPALTSHVVTDDSPALPSLPAASAFDASLSSHQVGPFSDPVDFYRGYQDDSPATPAGIAIPISNSTNSTIPPSTSPGAIPSSASTISSATTALFSPFQGEPLVSNQAAVPAPLAAPQVAVNSPSGLAGPDGLNAKQATPFAQSSSSSSFSSRSARSVSNPADHSRVPLTGGASIFGSRRIANSSHTSVKDLTKRFDQIESSPTLSPAAASNGRLRSTSRPGYSSAVRGRSPGAPVFLSSSPAATTSRLKSPDSRREHHPPAPVGSPQSFASRIAKPRTASFTSNDETPKASMTQLSSPRSGRLASPPPPQPMGTTNGGGLLFGEILPEDSNAFTAGYGIGSTSAAPRRTSESSLMIPQAANHSDEPASPTDWYRTAGSPREENNQQRQHPPQVGHHRTRIPMSHTNHKRSMSDLAGSKQKPSRSPPRSRANTHNTGSHVRMPSADSANHPTSPSRLPVSVKKLAGNSTSTSPASTRSSSPSATTGRRPLVTARKPQQTQVSPPSASTNIKAPLKRAATPTSTSTSTNATTPRAKPPYHPPPPPPTSSASSPPTTRRQPPPSHIATPTSAGRLNAYISVPPPKLSPPLRSSRPRQPVSSAGNTSGTRSGRTSAAERGRTYANSTRSSAAKQEEGEARRRKIDVGPIDFAQRRETIRLAYSKSIRETEAKAARQAAAERRKKEMEAAARAKALAEAAVRAQSDVSGSAQPASSPAPTPSSSSAAAAAAGSGSTPSGSPGHAASTAATAATMEASAALAAATTAVANAPQPSSISSHTINARPVTPPLPSPSAASAAIAAHATATAAAAPNGPTAVHQQQQARQSLRVSTSMAALQNVDGSLGTGRQSPALGIPGTFPDFGGTPPRSRRNADDDIPPPSAVSQRSVVTEFDNEEQTEPPVPESARSPFTNGISHEKAEYRSPFDMAAPDDQVKQMGQADTQQQHHQLPSFPKAEYHYPFEDEGVMVEQQEPSAALAQPFDGGFIPGSYQEEPDTANNIDTARPYTPPAEANQQPQSGSTYATPMGKLRSPGRQLGEKQDLTTEVDAVTPRGDDPTVNRTGVDSGSLNHSSGPEFGHNDDAELVQQAYGQASEFEVQPYQPDSKHTTVTILSRDTEHTTPRPPLMRGHSSGRTVATDSSASSRLGNLEEFYTGPSVRDNAAALRDSAFASSDISDELILPPGGEMLRTPETSNSLTIPPLLSPANRSSQQSGWTDFSIESADARDYLASRDSSANGTGANNVGGTLIRIRNGGPSATTQTQRSPYQFDSRPQSMTDNEQQQGGYGSSSGNSYTNSYNNSNQNLDTSLVSPLDKSAPNNVQPISQASTNNSSNSQLLPELDTGTNFFVPYLSSAAKPAIPVLPDHDPPPVPVSSDDRSSFAEGSSAYYDSSRPNSFAQRDDQGSFSYATDDSMVLPPPTLPTQPSNPASLEMGRQSISGATLVDNEMRQSGDVTTGGSTTAGEGTGAAPGTNGEKQAPSKEQTRLIQRQMVIRELIDTEAIFVRDMNIVEEIYKGTAEACPKLDDKTVKLIFRNSNEIIAFHTTFLSQLKDGVSSVYAPKGGRKASPLAREGSMRSEAGTVNTINSTTSAAGTLASNSSTAANGTNAVEAEDTRDRQTSIGPVFRKNIDQMRIAHEGFLRSSDNAAKRLIQIQEDPTVKVWLSECNEVAKDLTAAWNLDSLLIKPMQRITKYPNLISQLLQYTPADHPDRPALMAARTTLETAILDINKTKKNFELVGQIVGRKRKESDVRAGFARAFGKRVDKLQASSSRPVEDQVYNKLNEKFGDDYLRLQVVLRDVEFYTRQVSTYVHEFLQLLSAMELVMRLQPSPYPELESKWARFNVSMRDMEKVALEQHLAQVRKHVIEPFELVIKCYGNPGLAMKKRAKRRVDYERAAQLKKSGKKVDKQLSDQVEQYEALNEALKKELPILSAKTEKIGNICMANFVSIQARWFAIWKDKVRVVLEEQYHQQDAPEISDIVTTFQREYHDIEDHIKRTLTILNKDSGPGVSSSGSGSANGSTGMLRSLSNKPSDTMASPRVRGGSVNSDGTPSLASPEFSSSKRNSGQFAQFSVSSPQPQGQQQPASATSANSGALPSPHQFYFRNDYYGSPNANGHAAGSSAGLTASPVTPGMLQSSSSNPSVNSPGAGGNSYYSSGGGRPGTGRSYDSGNAPRPSIESNMQNGGGGSISQPVNAHYPPNASMTNALNLNNSRRDSSSTFNSNNNAHGQDNGSTTGSGRRFSGLFHSALPVNDDERTARSNNLGLGGSMDDGSRRSSRASSRERTTASGYNIMWLAASLFEFNIETKSEAGYPYLTYQAGEIFDVIAEKGELWLAKNQDDPVELVGWIWSKHFAKLADS